MKKTFRIFLICLTILPCILLLTACNKKPNNDEGKTTSPNTYNGMVYYASSQDDSGSKIAESYKKGGFICINKDEQFVLYDDDVISGYESKYGGAIYIKSGGKFVMQGGTIQENQAAYGGAIYVESGATCIINNGVIKNNKGQKAPAIYAENGAIVQISKESSITTNILSNVLDITLNFYVDGILNTTVSKTTLTFKENELPLTYEECNGYFADSRMLSPIEIGEQITPLEQQTNVNLYTKSATVEKLAFNTYLEEYSVTKNAHTEGNIVIPRQYLGKNVVLIEQDAFNENYDITTVYIPPTITTIGSDAFRYSYLEDINIHKNLININENAFFSCRYLTGELDVRHIKNLGKSAFYGTMYTKAYVGSADFVVPANVFMNCSELTEIYLEDGVKIISDSAFRCCKKLKEIFIPNSVEKIGSYAFHEDQKLEKCNIPENVTNIGLDAFRKCSNLIRIDYDAVNCISSSWPFYESATSGKELVIDFGNTVKRIPKHLFWIKNGIKTIMLPEGLEIIETEAFIECSELETITIPSTVSTIQPNAFSKCTSLKNIYYNAKTAADMEMSSSPFSNSGKEAIVTIGKNVEIIPKYMFTYLPGTIISQLKFEVGSKCELIDQGAFENSTLESIDFTNAASLIKIASASFKNNDNLPAVNIPDSVKTIGYGAFESCLILQAVNFGQQSNLIDIQARAFYNCESIRSLYLPSKLKCIRAWAFQGTGIISITIPASVMYLGKSAFLTQAATTNLEIIFENKSGWYLTESSDGEIGSVDYKGTASYLIDNNYYVNVSSNIANIICTEFANYHLMTEPLTEDILK